MKTRDFTSDAEVAALVAGFEEATVPASEFTHAAHIAVALSYLEELPAEQALARVREKIRAFAAHHGVDNLYHETLTVFWMKLLDHVSSNQDVDSSRRSEKRLGSGTPATAPAKADLPLWRRINLIVARWGTRAPIDAHYSRELIASKVAREQWTPPDRLPIPF
jgi:hypothetical protein